MPYSIFQTRPVPSRRFWFGVPDSRFHKGVTLIETVIYITLFTLVFSAATGFLINILHVAIAVRADQALVANIALALKTMELEVRHADAVYASTSVFDNDGGQLSLRTPRSAPTDHEAAYVDFYLDNGVVYERRDDGSSPLALTSGDIDVSVFRIERYTSSSAEGVRLIVTAEPANVSTVLTEPRTLRTFVVIRPFTP